jgi:hypothetical protein
MVAGAAGPKSLSYSMDYAVTGSGGESSTGSQYSIVGRITAKGFATQPVASARYSIQPVVGSASSSAPAHVRDWSLY